MQNHDFTPATTNHAGNIEGLKGQNKRLYDWLSRGNTINIFSPAMQELGIGYLNSRISDLKNKCGIAIYHKSVKINGIHCNEYSMTPFLEPNKK